MGQSIPSKTFEWTSSSRERCQNTANFRLRLHIIIIIACWWWLGASHVISQNWCPLTQHTVATDSTSTKTFNWLTDSKEISCRLPFNTQSSWTGRSAKVKTLWKTVHHQLKQRISYTLIEIIQTMVSSFILSKIQIMMERGAWKCFRSVNRPVIFFTFLFYLVGGITNTLWKVN